MLPWRKSNAPAERGSRISLGIGPLLAAGVIATGILSSTGSVNMPDLSNLASMMETSVSKKWLVRAFVLSAVPVILFVFRVNVEQNNRKNILEAARSLHKAGREVNSASLSETTGMTERTVQIYLPAIAIGMQARTRWYKDGSQRHQRLEMLRSNGF